LSEERSDESKKAAQQHKAASGVLGLGILFESLFDELRRFIPFDRMKSANVA